MKVIGLKGRKGSGKSHTINIVYSFLLRDGYSQVPGYFRVLGNPKFEDVFDILTKDGVKVGIIGMGDFQKGKGGLGNLIKGMEKNGCDVVVCACRNEPKIEKGVTQYKNHHFVDKTISTGNNNNRIVNVIDAERVIRLI